MSPALAPSVSSYEGRIPARTRRQAVDYTVPLAAALRCWCSFNIGGNDMQNTQKPEHMKDGDKAPRRDEAGQQKTDQQNQGSQQQKPGQQQQGHRESGGQQTGGSGGTAANRKEDSR
jgi:hypothetical protein